jgi:hypothetical protein
MLILADYEGLSVAVGSFFGMVIMAPGFLMGLGGTFAGSRRPPWCRTALGLGIACVLLGLLGIAFALGACWEDWNHVNLRGEHFWPPAIFWLAAVATLWAGAWAMWLGITGRGKRSVHAATDVN